MNLLGKDCCVTCAKSCPKTSMLSSDFTCKDYEYCPEEKRKRDPSIIHQWIKIYVPYSCSRYEIKGCLVGVLNNIGSYPVVTIGLSIRNRKDKFNRETGYNLATQRTSLQQEPYNIYVNSEGEYYQLCNEILNFTLRCSKYFKGAYIIHPTNICFVSNNERISKQLSYI